MHYHVRHCRGTTKLNQKTEALTTVKATTNLKTWQEWIKGSLNFITVKAIYSPVTGYGISLYISIEIKTLVAYYITKISSTKLLTS